uniref:Uncharacterized protein n=1 Tax=Pseudo-nitzschia australis TaxID=44445 RepID=A0A7S4AIN9_9STRA|mmetsp:Transcript_23231/g.48759  ORF Transcript_23231/g.48759 Transcript_23231/m.48759 type:complete len:149 (+) Transcript_23231:305-751(+)
MNGNAMHAGLRNARGSTERAPPSNNATHKLHSDSVAADPSATFGHITPHHTTPAPTRPPSTRCTFKEKATKDQRVLGWTELTIPAYGADGIPVTPASTVDTFTSISWCPASPGLLQLRANCLVDRTYRSRVYRVIPLREIQLDIKLYF